MSAMLNMAATVARVTILLARSVLSLVWGTIDSDSLDPNSPPSAIQKIGRKKIFSDMKKNYMP
jgi:hypothetical protein